ncbi:hypothetical protein K431DRAFT_222919 [Polychaeton citri CBS 116435]|uniref:Uncharacterized protein n=1 Tax=Polychaeton citri CBS 116435 TaxID=1314669 RepID=A0A9P4QC27_9PEZI|nr:hypothetical protein K431DRAFT_222919 [Polychaeton citri CBS 116435]
MFLDARILGANATDTTAQEWAAETYLRLEVLWTIMILTHFAGLFHLNAFTIHAVSVCLKRFLHERTYPPIYEPSEQL